MKCVNGHKVVLNPSKHQNREKYCPVCRVVVANAQFNILASFKSLFQKLKWERKSGTRSRFIERMKQQGLSDHEIVIRLEKRFKEEVA